MESKPIRKYAADIFTNIAASVLIALVAGIGGAVMVYLGAAWAKPLLVGGAFFLITLLVLLAIKAIRLLPKMSDPTTPGNIELRVRDWLDTFGLTVTKSKPPNVHFRLDVIVNGRTIGVLRPVDGGNYLHLFANIAPDSDDKQALAGLSDSEKTATMVALKLELARGRMGYVGFSLEGFTIFKRIAVNTDLSEAVFIEGIWEMEAMLNALFIVAASLNIKHEEVAKLVSEKNASETPEYVEGPEALKKFEDGMKNLFKAPKAKSPFKSSPAKTKGEPSKD